MPKLPTRWKPVANGRLGHGGQGQVRIVEDNTGKLSGRYALKLLTRKTRQAHARFAREVEAINKVVHPNVIEVYDHSEPDDDCQYYVMELIENAVTLKSLMGTAQNPFFQNPGTSIEFMVELLQAIAAWNSEGIVHRDLSPANVLVVPAERRIQVIDFGICQVEDGGGNHAQ